MWSRVWPSVARTEGNCEGQFMGFLHDMGMRARQMIGPLIGICSIAYFGFHVVHGDRGLLTYWRLQQKIIETQPLLDEARNQRVRLANRVQLLRPDNLDLDMLEERARIMLNFGYRDDVVILYDQESET